MKIAFPFQTRWILAALILLLPWLLASRYLWSLSPHTLLLPLSDDSFRIFFEAIGNHRFTLPHFLIQPILIGICILGPLTLFLWYEILKNGLSDLPLASFWALNIAIFFYALGAPGRIPEGLLEFCFISLLIIPLFNKNSAVQLWALASFLLIISLITQKYIFAIFWTTFSLLLGHLLSFFLADLGKFPRRMRSHFKTSLASGIGILCLAFFILLTTYRYSFQNDLLESIDQKWWLAWILSILSFLLSWLRPWETSRWLSLVIFGHGILFSSSLKTSIYFAIAWCLIALLSQIPIPKNASESKGFQTAKKAFQICWVLVAGVWIFIQVRSDHPKRNFFPAWVSIAREISATPAPGYLIIGEGRHFLSMFFPSEFVESPDMILENSEQKFLDFMHEQKLSEVIVDKNYLNRFWQKWIADKQPPDQANRSVISRMISYEGKAVKTPTLDIPAIIHLTAVPFKTTEDLIKIVIKEN
ncbi:MAG: hypothetical protein J0L93_02185 [Deltaproteobacteria bacterium]|nr:hypothetical protein [Deltaproteobacteria bacterium]